MADYGAFVEIEKGVEGLIHSSEMSWVNKNINPSSFLNVGDEVVEVMILEIDNAKKENQSRPQTMFRKSLENIC